MYCIINDKIHTCLSVPQYWYSSPPIIRPPHEPPLALYGHISSALTIFNANLPLTDGHPANATNDQQNHAQNIVLLLSCGHFR